MAKKAEKSDIVADNPLATANMEKMIRVIRDKQVLLDLYSVLKSKSTIRINIAIMWTFVQCCHYMMENG